MFNVLSLNAGRTEPSGGSETSLAVLLRSDNYDIICIQEGLTKYIDYIPEEYRHSAYGPGGTMIFSRHPVINRIHYTFKNQTRGRKKGLCGITVNFKGSFVHVFNISMCNSMKPRRKFPFRFRRKVLPLEIQTLQLIELKNTVQCLSESDHIILTGNFNIDSSSKLFGLMYNKLTSVGVLDTFDSHKSLLQSTVSNKCTRVDYIWFTGMGHSKIVKPSVGGRYAVVGNLRLPEE